MNKFMDCFAFNPSKSLLMGVERECFLTNNNGEIVPIADKVLKHLMQSRPVTDLSWGYELSACQLESRCGPCSLDEIEKSLMAQEQEITVVEKQIGFSRNHDEVAPETMPLDVFPDPSGRYQEIVKKMPREVLLAACRVIGTHIHVGMPNHEDALRVYNSAIDHTNVLCKLGDKSEGKRLEIYKVVAPECLPPRFESWQEFHTTAIKKGFDSDPRKCWTLIRISKHGTIEFRMFGATKDICEISRWAKYCHKICRDALLS